MHLLHYIYIGKHYIYIGKPAGSRNQPRGRRIKGFKKRRKFKAKSQNHSNKFGFDSVRASIRQKPYQFWGTPAVYFPIPPFSAVISHFTLKVSKSHMLTLPLARYLNKLFLILKFSSPRTLLFVGNPSGFLQSPPHPSIFLMPIVVIHLSTCMDW